MNSNFEEIFQGWLEKEEYNKNKGFLKKSKYWKKYFSVLRRYEGDANVYLQWFEKEEDWRKEFPKGSFGLFPKYSVYKHKTEKGKNYFEVSNDEEAHYFLANNEKTVDLWVIQLMMQTRLSASMIETSFRVKGDESKCLQRIGAKNLNCLLHLSEWGMTLALERTHSVLSQWPLTTIRNYECTDHDEFLFEAGRKSPMGEGKYMLHTTNSEDNAIFDQLDRYTSMRARRVRAGGRNRLNSANDEEIAQAYGQLRWSVMLTNSTLNLGVINAMPSEPQAIVQNHNQVYNHLDRKPSTHGGAIGDSYDRLDRTGSLSDRLSLERSYSRLNCNNALPGRTESQRSMSEQQMKESDIHGGAIEGDSYDRLDRAGSLSDRLALERSYSRLNCNNALPGRTESQRSMSEQQMSESDTHCGAIGDSYDRLDRTGSFSDRLSLERSYSRQNCNNGLSGRTESQRSTREHQMSDSYDHLERTPSFTGSPSSADSRSRSFGSLEGKTRFQIASPPPDDSYNQLARNRIASLPSSSSPRNMEFYDKLDRSMASLHQASRSYDRLDSRDIALSPPVPSSSNDPNAYDTFGNVRAHTPTHYQFVKPGQGIQDQEPLLVELPPPLPEKPSFMSKGEKKPKGILSPPSSPFTISAEKQDQPLPPRPTLNGENRPRPASSYSNQEFPIEKQANTQNGLDTSNVGSHYQAVDEDTASKEIHGSHYQAVDKNASKDVGTNGSHYQAMDNEKSEAAYDEPRGRLNTHSSDPDLFKNSGGKSNLDPSKKNTLHRSAPSLALYSVINKRKGSKGSTKAFSKSGSTFKLFKKIGRSSKKSEDEVYEKMPRKNKKSQKKDARVVSTSSLRPLVQEDDPNSYVDVDGDEGALARDIMERRDSKRPLPDLPDPDEDV